MALDAVGKGGAELTVPVHPTPNYPINTNLI